MRALTAALLLLTGLPAALGEEPPATEASIRELIEVTGASKMLDQMRPQLESTMDQMFQQMIRGKDLTPAQQQVLADMRAELTALLMQELAWSRYEPMIVQIYGKSFSQAEVDGMVAFYRTDVGRAVIAKMPLVMQHTMAVMQDNLRTLVPKLEAIQKRSAERFKALESPPS